MSSRRLQRRAAAVAAAACLATSAGSALGQVFQDQGADALGTQPCGGVGCWTNYARVTDYDGDGDLDLVAVNSDGWFEPAAEAQPLTVYRNDGAGSFTSGDADFGNFSGSARQIAFGDFDGDGALDAYLPAANAYQPDALFMRVAGAFVNEATTRLPAGMSSHAGAARAGDVDGDGDLDLLVADGYLDQAAVPAHLYSNDGTGHFTEAPVGALPSAKNGIYPVDLDLADVDGDFDLDVYVNMHEGQGSLWLNDGKGTFSDASSTLPPLSADAQYHYGPVFCDIDGDGDRDLLIDNTADNYEEQILVNDGAGHFTDETAARVIGNLYADDNLVVCVDFDGDGDLDIAVGALSTKERLFENDGAGVFSVVTGAFAGPTDPTLWMEFGDLDGDGRLDAFTAQGEGVNNMLERVYLGTSAVVVDTLGPSIFAVESVTLSATEPRPVRFAVSDSTVSDEGARLSGAWIEVGDQKIDAHFVGGDLYRAVAPATNEIDLRYCARDLAGNETCRAVGGGQGGGGQGGAGGAGGAAGAGGASDDGGMVGDSEYCGCRTPGFDQPGRFSVGVTAIALAALALRRRRASARNRSTRVERVSH